MLDRWDPWKDLDKVWREMDRIFDAYLERLSPDREVDFVPPAEVGEEPGGVVVRLAIPGVLEEDIDITVESDRITVRGERQPPAGYGRSEWAVNEIRYGTFLREIPLPDKAVRDEIRAAFSDGMLTIRVPVKGS